MTDFDPTKPVRTRSGCEAIIDKVLSPEEALTGGETIIGRKRDSRGISTVGSWWSDGRYTHASGLSNCDLINVAPPDPQRFVNLWRVNAGARITGKLYDSAQAALNSVPYEGRSDYVGTFRLVRVDRGETR